MNVSLIGHQSQENQERPLVGAAQTGAPSESVSRSVGPTLCDPRDCSPPGSSVHEIFQARILEWGAIAFSAICQQIWKTQQWPQDWKRSVFILIPKEFNAKECSNYHTVALISHTSKVMLKILQARLQQYVN